MARRRQLADLQSDGGQAAREHPRQPLVALNFDSNGGDDIVVLIGTAGILDDYPAVPDNPAWLEKYGRLSTLVPLSALPPLLCHPGVGARPLPAGRPGRNLPCPAIGRRAVAATLVFGIDLAHSAQ